MRGTRSAPSQRRRPGSSGAAMFARSGRTARDRRSGPSPGPPEPGVMLAAPTEPAFRKGANVNDRTWERIERSRERWDVLRHPFYRRWSDGELSAEELARYSGQYRHAVEAIATMSTAAADALPERPELRRHAAEELGHVRLWDGFVEACGGDAADAPTPETARVRARLDRGRRRARDAGAPVRDRERPAADLTHQARGPARALRLRRRRRAPLTSASTRAATSSTPPRSAS